MTLSLRSSNKVNLYMNELYARRNVFVDQHYSSCGESGCVLARIFAAEFAACLHSSKGLFCSAPTHFLHIFWLFVSSMFLALFYFVSASRLFCIFVGINTRRSDPRSAPLVENSLKYIRENSASIQSKEEFNAAMLHYGYVEHEKRTCTYI